MEHPIVEDNAEITEVIRFRPTEVLNGQPVDANLVELAKDDEAVNTAVVSFFDVDYVRKAEDENEQSERARSRSIVRRNKESDSFIR